MSDGPRQFLVATIHMGNPIVFPWWRSARIRSQQLEALFAWADESANGRAPFILAGDMNASPAWPIYKQAGRPGGTTWWPRYADESGEAAAPTWAWRPRSASSAPHRPCFWHKSESGVCPGGAHARIRSCRRGRRSLVRLIRAVPNQFALRSGTTGPSDLWPATRL